MRWPTTTHLGAICLALAVGSAAAEQVGYVAGNDATTNGVLWGQPAGVGHATSWSGGAQTNFSFDDASHDNGDGTYGDEKVMSNGMVPGMSAHGGSQFWRFSRGLGDGYGYGAGTPFSPNAGGNMPADGDTIAISFWFRPATTNAGDDCAMAIETRNVAGSDRSDILGYLHNSSGTNGLYVRIFDYVTGYAVVASNLDRTVWHEFTAVLEYQASSLTCTNGTNYDTFAVSVDGGAPATNVPYLNAWRLQSGYGYSEHSGLKLRPDPTGSQQYDGDTARKGFLFDDLSITIYDAATPNDIAYSYATGFEFEPATFVLANASVAENEPTGTTVGAFSTADPEGTNTFTYTLVAGAGDDDNGSFAISGSNLQTAVSFNYEVQSNFSIRAQSTPDGGGPSTQRVFAVTATDMDETPTLLDLQAKGTNVVLQWSSVTNHLYSVHAATNLLTGFSVLASNIPATPTVNTYTTSVQGAWVKYWRVTTVP